MSDFNRGYARSIPADRADMSVDAGLRSFMLGVYNKVALGLLLSAALAFVTGQFAPVQALLYKVTADGRLAGLLPLGYVIAFAPLVVLLFSMAAIRNASPRSSGILYWTIVSLIGASLGVLTLVYTGASIASTFMVTAAAFGGLSLFGYTTKRDLTGFGSFLMIGLIGLVLASVVNIFLHSGPMNFIISVLGGVHLRGPDRLRHPAPEDDLLPAGRRPVGHGRGDQLRRAQPLHQLHQPLPDAAQPVRQPPLSALSIDRIGPRRETSGAFFFAALRSGGKQRLSSRRP